MGSEMWQFSIFSNSNNKSLLLIFCLVLMPEIGVSAEKPTGKRLDRIALGSCAHQEKPQPFWGEISELNPDLFLFLGDNLYSDTHDMMEHERNYKKLFSVPGFRDFVKDVPVLAIWDDHDYGWNDSGADYPKKKESLKIFRKYFRQNSKLFPPKSDDGIFRSVMIGPPDYRVQVVLLDTRYFRSKPLKSKRKLKVGRYIPNYKKGTTVLGEKQWLWLEKELKKPAKLRIIASGYQVLSTSHHWESWNNFPRERERLINLVKGHPGIIFVSGDRHQSRFYRLKNDARFIYEITSSSLTNKISNPKRDEAQDPLAMIPAVFDLNFSSVDIDWNNQFLVFSIYSTQGALLNRVRIPFFNLGI